MDDRLGLVEVAASCVEASTGWQLADTAWPDAVRAAQLAIGHELVGASAAMVALACDHARERIQFDRPIAAFQAVRHRLADSLVAVESARAMLDGAWEDGSGETASMAKAVAGRAARTAARHCQQVLAGIGFTVEHPLHRFVRRVLVLDELFGSARSLTKALGTELIANRRLPPPLAL
jgi:alkylation response protein AidB-like acyl-CoA dehydrogenase